MPRSGFGRSLGYALAGLAHAWRTQANLRFHFGAALLVLLVAFMLGVPAGELSLLCLTIALVLVAEMFNTALEAVVDLCSRDRHPLAKAAKDVAAGAVLLAAVNAVVVGVLVFYPYLMALWHRISSAGGGIK
ncbi:MAG: diacylglycerol kinase family protein [Thermoanaerobacteraceae bacterium]|nr:diacylglycerol kinase family protein [Thermoanaerobacteraceae bacterium]